VEEQYSGIINWHGEERSLSKALLFILEAKVVQEVTMTVFTMSASTTAAKRLLSNRGQTHLGCRVRLSLSGNQLVGFGAISKYSGFLIFSDENNAGKLALGTT